MKRCVPYVIKNEGLDSEQAVGKCSGMYDSWVKKNKKNEESDMKAERIHLDLCATIFGNVKQLLKENQNLDSATLIVGDAIYNGIYFPAEELEKAYKTWERQPINLDHSDKVEDEIGYLKDVMYDRFAKSITAKPVINDYMPKADIAKGYIKSRIEAGKIPEGSIGVWLDRIPEEMEDGKIRLTARNLQGDHYAIVSRGACSPEQGCGIGLKEIEPIPITITIPHDDYVGLENKLRKELIKEQIKKEKLKGGK